MGSQIPIVKNTVVTTNTYAPCIPKPTEKRSTMKIERVEDNSAKAKKTRVVENNKSITSALLNNFRK